MKWVSYVIRHALLRHNVTFRYVLAFIVVGSTLILTVPSMQHVLEFSPRGWGELGMVAATGCILLLFELTKMAMRQNIQSRT